MPILSTLFSVRLYPQENTEGSDLPHSSTQIRIHYHFKEILMSETLVIDR